MFDMGPDCQILTWHGPCKMHNDVTTTSWYWRTSKVIGTCMISLFVFTPTLADIRLHLLERLVWWMIFEPQQKQHLKRIARKNSSDRWSPPLATPCSVAVGIQWIRISRRLAGCHSNDMLLHQIVWCLATPMICYRIVAYMLFHPIALYCTVSCHFNDMLLHRIVWCLVTSMICFCIKLYGVLPLQWYAIAS